MPRTPTGRSGGRRRPPPRRRSSRGSRSSPSPSTSCGISPSNSPSNSPRNPSCECGRAVTIRPPMLYATEPFSADEVEILERYFTNVDRPVFALVNLPEVVKGALFARYSRTHKSLRRLFLDEFADDVDAGGDGPD